MRGRGISEAELGALYQRYGPLLLRRARRIVGDEAEDVVQEVFVSLMRRPPGHEALRPWLYRACVNACICRVRHRSRRQGRWVKDVEATLEARRGASVEDVLADKDAVVKLMSRMPPKLQQVAALVLVDEMSMQEAASTLGVTRKTVYNRLEEFRGRAEKVLNRW